jgi:5-methylthioadenosine/S-adenosylhomocysteine deaminase
LKEVDILIRNCIILPMVSGEIIKEGIIATKNDKIIYMGKKSKAPRLRAEKIIDGHGKVAMPGLVNCHTHLAMTLFRGIAEDQPLEKWLKETIWPLEAKLKPRDIYDGALLGCLEMIKSGTTTFADMYFYEDHVAKTVEKAGLRAVLAQGILEAGVPRRGEKMLQDSVNFARRYKGYAYGRVTVQLGPHALYTCSPSLLAKVRQKASDLNVGIHMHLAESEETVNQTKQKHDLAEVELLEKIGFLDSDVLAAHCIHLTEKEMQLLAKHDVKVSYNPVANMKLAQGAAKIKDLLDLGVTVGIGTDGPASNNNLDMFQSMKIATLLQKQYYKDPTVLPAQTVLKMATIDGAKALGLEKTVGSLEVGKKADVILIDFKKPHLTPVHDFYANIVYSASGSDVDTVIVDGKTLMENKNVKTLDEEEVVLKAQKTATDIPKRKAPIVKFIKNVT